MPKKKTIKHKLENQGEKDPIAEKLDLVIKLMGVIATQKGISEKNQQEQIVVFNKMGFRNKDTAIIFGIKPQQVNTALKRSKKKKPRKNK